MRAPLALADGISSDGAIYIVAEGWLGFEGHLTRTGGEQFDGQRGWHLATLPEDLWPPYIRSLRVLAAAGSSTAKLDVCPDGRLIAYAWTNVDTISLGCALQFD